MELKSYDKLWLPVFKGAFLILFGIIAMLQIVGSIKMLAALFVMLIGMIALLLISTGLLFRRTKFRWWTIISGLINLAFCIYVAVNMASPRNLIIWTILVWVFFYALSEIIEAGLLFNTRNAFAALFLMNALLTLLFGYFLFVLLGNFTAQGVFYLGVIAFVFGIINELSAFLLNKVKEKN
jgi:uncharacterized membrane protein HdeD (DUF308 family)